jgi:hypothetical protein
MVLAGRTDQRNLEQGRAGIALRIVRSRKEGTGIMSAVQYELFQKTHQQAFDDWVHTEEGREAADRFIRLAWAAKKRGVRVGAKAIWERLRWHYEFVAIRSGNDGYRLNNVYTAYMARFAMDRDPNLQGFFETRTVGKDAKPRRAILVNIRPGEASHVL